MNEMNEMTTPVLPSLENADAKEIAEAIGCDNSSVRMNLSRARRSVREAVTNALNYGVKRN